MANQARDWQANTPSDASPVSSAQMTELFLGPTTEGLFCVSSSSSLHLSQHVWSAKDLQTFPAAAQSRGRGQARRGR